MIERDAQAYRFLLETVLEPDEEVRWTGRGTPAAAARVAGGLPPAPTLGVTTAVVLLGAWAWGNERPLPFLLAVLGLGLWVVTTPWRHRWRAAWLYYAVTDRRALVIEATFGLRVHVLPPAPFEREDDAHGHASFQPARGVAGLTGGFWGVRDADACAAALAARREPSAP